VPRAKYFNEVPPAAQLMQEHAKSFDDNRYILIGGELLGRALAGQVGDPPTVPQSAFAMRDLLLHEAGTAYGLAAIDGFEPIRSGRQNLLIGTVFSNRADLVLDLAKVKAGGRIDQAANTEVLKKVTPEEKAADIVGRLPLLSMLNVTYLISLYPLTSSQLTMLGSFHIEKPPLDYYVYINRLVMPRVYFASKPTFLEGSDRDLFIAMMETKDFSKKTYIECADCEAPKVTTASVGVIHTENGLLEAITTSSTGGWLVYSESNLPGWIAKIDGIRVPIQTANYLFMGIQVPKGDHSIEFRYVGSFALLLDAIGFKRL
jgi:hypothetical protein